MDKKDCKVRFCPECGTRLNQTYVKEYPEYCIVTRKCLKCKKYSIQVIECSRTDYNKNVDFINALRNVLSEI